MLLSSAPVCLFNMQKLGHHIDGIIDSIRDTINIDYFDAADDINIDTTGGKPVVNGDGINRCSPMTCG